MYLGYQNNKIKFYTQEPLNEVMYNLDKVEETTDKYILVGDEYVLATNEKALNQAKQAKIIENDIARDAALNQGVIYKDVLFDSDTDQKVNLLAIVSTMEDETRGTEVKTDRGIEESQTSIPQDLNTSITWFGKDNQPLECDKSDLINIGSLITELHSFCWNKNAQIKQLINEAGTVEEVEAIEIDYSLEV